MSDYEYTGKSFLHFKKKNNKGLPSSMLFNNLLSKKLVSSLELYSDKNRFLKENEIQYYDHLNIGFGEFSEKHKKALLLSGFVEAIYDEKRFKVNTLEPIYNSKPSNWGLEKLNILNTSLTGKNIKIAVLDSGIDLSHPDLKAKINLSKTRNFVYPNKKVLDTYGHGTHVTGILCGKSIADGFRYGVATDCDLYVGKVLNNSGGLNDQNWVIDGINWAIENECRLINLSLGIRVFNSSKDDKDFEKVINKAWESGCLVVCSVGNDSSRLPGGKIYPRPIHSPAECEKSIAVSAIDFDNQIYNKANRAGKHQKINFIAPGVDIYSSFVDLTNNKRYALLSGTSMAAPYITGLLALYMEKHSNLPTKKILDKILIETNAMSLNKKDVGEGLPQIQEIKIINQKNIIMSNIKDYQGTILLKADQGFQEVYSSQNYGTFYSIYMDFECTKDETKNTIKLSNINFKIINYKGVLNLGIVNLAYIPKIDEKDDSIISHVFEISVQALKSNRAEILKDENGVNQSVTIDLSKNNEIQISRTLLKMNTSDFDPNLGPNHHTNLVFDNEFYYRDGLEFKEEDNQRNAWGGMQGIGDSSSGKRCYQVTHKITT